MPSTRTNELLEELVALARIMVRPELERMLASVLEDQKHLHAYELMDGTRSQSEIAQAVGLSQPAISNLTQRWKRMGLTRSAGGKQTHVLKPSELGLRTQVQDNGDTGKRRSVKRVSEE